MLNRLSVIVLLGSMLGGILVPPIHAASKMKTLNDGYSLNDVIELAMEHNPVVAVGQGIIKEKKGQQLVAGAYPNPSLNVQLGRSEFRDSEVKIVTLERYVTVRQPLEWAPKRVARQQAHKLVCRARMLRWRKQGSIYEQM